MTKVSASSRLVIRSSVLTGMVAEDLTFIENFRPNVDGLWQKYRFSEMYKNRSSGLDMMH